MKTKLKKIISGCLSGIMLFSAMPMLIGSAAEEATVTWLMTTESEKWKNMGELSTTQWDNDTSLYIDVDQTTTYQQLEADPWGGCFNERGWNYMQKYLNETQIDEIMQALFGEEGLKMTAARMPIASSDYAIDMYSFTDQPDETATITRPDGSTFTTAVDYDMSTFNIDRDKELLIPYINAALELQPDLRIWASPWSPPYWMKADDSSWSNPRSVKSGGHYIGTPEMYSAYAEYFKKFIEAYREENIDIVGVAPQNEPTINTGYSSCIWTGVQLRDFIKDYLGPAMNDLGVEIYLGTFTDSADNRADPAMNDPEAAKYIDGVAFQWWSWWKARSVYNLGYDGRMLQSETMCGDGYNNWWYAENQFDLMWTYFESGIKEYYLWNMVLDTNGTRGGTNTTGGWYQNAPITVNTTNNTYNINPQYYQFKHFSHFIEPYARRIKTGGNYDGPYSLSKHQGDSQYTSELHEIAFQNPNGDNVLLVKNGSNSEKTVAINFNGRKIKPTLAAHSISTFVISGTATGDHDMTDFLKKSDTFTLTNAESGMLLSVDGDVPGREVDLIQWRSMDEVNQSWYFEQGNGENVKLYNAKTQLLVGVFGGSTAANAKTTTWNDTGTADQQWTVETVEKDDVLYSALKNAKSGLYMSTSNSAAAAAIVQTVKPANGFTDAQLWKLEMLESIEIDKSKLQEQYDEYKDFDVSGYTQDSASAFTEALENAKAVLDDQDATQKAVDNALGTLEGAIANLKRPEPTKYLIGDVDFDGEVKLKDALLVQKYVTRLTSFTDIQKFVANTYEKDTAINLKDVLIIQKFVAGIENGSYINTWQAMPE